MGLCAYLIPTPTGWKIVPAEVTTIDRLERIIPKSVEFDLQRLPPRKRLLLTKAERRLARKVGKSLLDDMDNE